MSDDLIEGYLRDRAYKAKSKARAKGRRRSASRGWAVFWNGHDRQEFIYPIRRDSWGDLTCGMDHYITPGRRQGWEDDIQLWPTKELAEKYAAERFRRVYGSSTLNGYAEGAFTSRYQVRKI